MTDEKNAKTAEMFICDICDFQCYKKSNYISHNLTAKHFRLTNASKNIIENANMYKCICGNEYKHRQSLHKHKQTCSEIADANYKNKIIEDLLKQNNELKEIILEQKEVFIEQIEYNKQLLGIAKEQKEIAHEQKELAKETKYLAQDQAEEQQEHNKRVLELAQEQKDLAQEQKELAQETKDIAQEQKELTIEQAEQTKILMEQIKEKGLGGGGTIINNTTTNNNTFNLNNYLTVTCKDAMNLKELIELVNQYDIPNKLIEMFEHGTHSSGVNRVMDEILNEIPVNKRPIHCSDLKREVLHIKSNDLWEKEDSNGAKLLAISFIDHIKHRVFGETLRWKNDVLNPNSDKDDDRYTRVLTQMIGPHSKTEAFVREKEKIKGHLAKKTLISKM
jgi:hypothetical protein